jgi:pSer/pThr/pTyr-binding forkhead associated (FHA) protein
MPFLRLYSGRHLQKQWSLTDASLTIGRAEDNDIVLQNPRVSKYHALIEKNGEAHILIDRDSANGVFINGAQIKRHTLNFWDEIQIHPYKLVYMALSKLPGEEEGLETQLAPLLQKEATVVIGADDIARSLRQMQEQKSNVVYLISKHNNERYVLDNAIVTVGRARSCDIRCGGLFAPALAATIELRTDGHYLIPAARARVFINGFQIQETVRLAENDRLEIQGSEFTYYIRPLR